MTVLYTIKNNKINNMHKTNKINKQLHSITRKNNNNTLERIRYSGFGNRITSPFSFTIVDPSSDEFKMLDKKFGKSLTDDEKWELYIKGE